MDIGLVTWAFHNTFKAGDLTLLDFLKLARREYGLSAVEVASDYLRTTEPAQLRDLRRVLDSEGLSLVNLAVNFGDLSNADQAARRADIEKIKAWFDIARSLHCPAIRVNTGRAELEDRAGLERTIGGYHELLGVAAQTGVKLLMEDHGGASSDAGGIAYILGQIASPLFGTCPDNDNFYGDDWEAGTRAMAPRAFCVHLKNHGYAPDGYQEGPVPWDGLRKSNLRTFIAILKDTGYSGPWCFEYNWAESDERVGVRKGIAYVQELLSTV